MTGLYAVIREGNAPKSYLTKNKKYPVTEYNGHGFYILTDTGGLAFFHFKNDPHIGRNDWRVGLL